MFIRQFVREIGPSFRLLGGSAWQAVRWTVFMMGLLLAIAHAAIGVVRQLFWPVMGMVALFVVPVLFLAWLLTNPMPRIMVF